VDKYFTGTTSSIEGIGVFEVAEEAIRIHKAAFEDTDPVLQSTLDAGGEYAWRVRGEEHMWTPDAIAKLQHSARQNSPQAYKEYAAIIKRPVRRHMTFPRPVRIPARPREARSPLRRSNPLAEIVKRFFDRRNVARLDLGRSAHHARGGDEPHRREIEHRRRGRGPQALRDG